MKSLFDTLNIVYGEKEKRGFVKLNIVPCPSRLPASRSCWPHLAQWCFCRCS